MKNNAYIALESGGLYSVEDYSYLTQTKCVVCSVEFNLTEFVETFVDRYSHRAYIIHIKCFVGLRALLTSCE